MHTFMVRADSALVRRTGGAVSVFFSAFSVVSKQVCVCVCVICMCVSFMCLCLYMHVGMCVCVCVSVCYITLALSPSCLSEHQHFCYSDEDAGD